MNKTAGARIRAARDLVRLPAKQLDRLAGLKPGTCWAVENSATGNSESNTLDKLTTVLGLSLDYVVRGEGEEPTAESVQVAVDAARAAMPEVPAKDPAA